MDKAVGVGAPGTLRMLLRPRACQPSRGGDCTALPRTPMCNLVTLGDTSRCRAG